MFIEIHMIQNFAPSNLNRDDTGNPKDCEFGGVRRARISSQAIKRAIREESIFTEKTAVPNGMRSKLLMGQINIALINKGKPEEEAEKAATTFAETLISKLDEKFRTNVLMFFSQEEIEQVANHLVDDWDNIIKEKPDLDNLIKIWIKETKDRTSAPDIALFGRMLAQKPDLNLDAAAQVAHAISTHRVNMDMDFWTAVDELQQEEETGAGMMGVTGFNSACFYRYHRIAWQQLLDNLGGNKDLACKTIEGFLHAAARAIPTGKQNAFAAQSPPSLLLAVVRSDGQSWSLVNAFERPVFPTQEESLVQKSITAMDQYWGRLVKVYGGEGVQPIVLLLKDVGLKNLAGNTCQSLQEWVDAVLAALPCKRE